MQRPMRHPFETNGSARDADLLVDVVCMRHGGIKLTPEQLRVEAPRRGHLHVDRDAARLTSGSDGAPNAGDVFPPLDPAHVYRISDEAWVLYGYEHPDGLPARKQAWYCTRVHQAFAR
jgi:hypothetical protein